MDIIICPDGGVRCIYDETIPLSGLGTLLITRASHVEPDNCGSWWADMAPVGGSKLGPFAQRSEALVAEQRWLNKHWLLFGR